MNYKKILIFAGSIILLITAIVYFYPTKKDTYFNKISLSNNNAVTNRSSYPYLDTVLSVGLDIKHIKNVYVIIKDLTPDVVEQLVVDGSVDVFGTIINRGNQYVIFIKPDLTKEKTIAVISHEIIHIQQYYNDEIKIDNENKRVFWKGEEYNLFQLMILPYKERPWEAQAFELEPSLSGAINATLNPN